MTQELSRADRARLALSTFAYMALYVALASVAIYLVPFLQDYVLVSIGVGTCYAVYLSVRSYLSGESDS